MPLQRVEKAQGQAAEPAIVLSGASVVTPIAQILSPDLSRVESELAAKVEKAAELLRDAPLVVDLAGVEKEALDLPALVALLRERGLVPIAVRGGNPAQQAAGRAAGLGIVRGGKAIARGAPPAAPAPPAAAPAPPATAPAPLAARAPAPPPARDRLIAQPVRSGQRVFNPNGDVVVIGQVNAGAEVAAGGHIHVYGPLRGCAMAGVNGDHGARIFTTCWEARIVAIAGFYRTLEADLPEVLGRPAQVRLEGSRLVIEPLAEASEAEH